LIFVTVGGMRAFERLVREMDRIASGLDDRVVMQIGSTDYEPENCDYFRFVPRSEMEKLVAEARVVVSHAGAGSIVTALEHNKPLVLVPRTKWYDEVFDDHQLEIATEMANRGVTIVYDTSELASAIRNANASPPNQGAGGDLAGRLKEYLSQLDGEVKA
jgi:beta-1,4-N-acetylglucosaminyltransferase